MSMFPSDPKKIRERIRRYERELARDWSDGYGKRFLLGPLYMLLGDTDGAIASFEWYEAAVADQRVFRGVSYMEFFGTIGTIATST